MNLDVPLSLEPTEAAPVDDLPAANDLSQYEPKIDGFRCIIFRDGDEVHLQSKNQCPLERFFPEMVAGVKALRRKRFVLDDELVIPGAPFDALQARLHPPASRTEKLSRESEARDIQRPLPDGSLRNVLRGEKQDGDGELVDLAAQASEPHAELPLPLFKRTSDRPDGAATVAIVENTASQAKRPRQ